MNFDQSEILQMMANNRFGFFFPVSFDVVLFRFDTY